MPSKLATTNKQGVPVFSIGVAFVVGCIAFGPFKSWNQLVSVVTSATAIMYGFAPVALAALHRLDPDRPRTYRMPAPKVILRLAFASANLIIYWGGFDVTWKLALAMVVGLGLFAIGAMNQKTGAQDKLRNSWWMLLWLAGHVVIGYLGRYGNGIADVLPEWIDIGVVVVFALGIFELALRTTLSREESAAAIAKDAHQLEFETP